MTIEINIKNLNISNVTVVIDDSVNDDLEETSPKLAVDKDVLEVLQRAATYKASTVEDVLAQIIIYYDEEVLSASNNPPSAIHFPLPLENNGCESGFCEIK